MCGLNVSESYVGHATVFSRILTMATTTDVMFARRLKYSTPNAGFPLFPISADHFYT